MVNERFEPSAKQEEILDLLTENRDGETPWGMTNTADIRQRTSIEDGNVSYHLNELLAAGWIDRRARGLYVFVDDPRERQR